MGLQYTIRGENQREETNTDEAGALLVYIYNQ